jgi:hypothetical protein
VAHFSFGELSGGRAEVTSKAFVLEAAVLLVFDRFAEHRALAYTSWLAGLR